MTANGKSRSETFRRGAWAILFASTAALAGAAPGISGPGGPGRALNAADLASCAGLIGAIGGFGGAPVEEEAEPSMLSPEQIQLSKFLSTVLRHQGPKLGVPVDGNGWADVDVVLAAVHRNLPGWRNATVEDLRRICDAGGKTRHEIQGTKIRATHGHTLPVVVDVPPSAPPETLFHASPMGALPKIGESGLKPMSRQKVHLTPDPTEAMTAAVRKGGQPFLIAVNALRAHEDGQPFQQTSGLVWLADAIPPEYLVLPPLKSTDLEADGNLSRAEYVARALPAFFEAAYWHEFRSLRGVASDRRQTKALENARKRVEKLGEIFPAKQRTEIFGAVDAMTLNSVARYARAYQRAELLTDLMASANNGLGNAQNRNAVDPRVGATTKKEDELLKKRDLPPYFHRFLERALDRADIRNEGEYLALLEELAAARK